MKKCPMCAEEVQDEAKICKHCKSDIVIPEKKEEVVKKKSFLKSWKFWLFLGILTLWSLKEPYDQGLFVPIVMQASPQESYIRDNIESIMKDCKEGLKKEYKDPFSVKLSEHTVYEGEIKIRGVIAGIVSGNKRLASQTLCSYKWDTANNKYSAYEYWVLDK